MFWLGALGGLFPGRWPGGRGPAWETGEPDPWPTPERRMGLLQEEAAGEEPALDELARGVRQVSLRLEEAQAQRRR